MPDVGICVPYRGASSAAAVAAGVEAARLGFRAIWVSELAGYDAVAVAAAIAVQAPGAQIGTAIVPSTTRSPALLAMAAATLEGLAPGRAVLGLGASSPPIVAGWHGRDATRPVAAMRDVLDVLDVAFSGAPTRHAGTRLSSNGFRLDTPPNRPRWYLGALGRHMRALSHERADGTILNFTPRRALPALVSAAPDGHELVLMVRVGAGDADTEHRFRRELASYLGVPGYARFFAEHGYGAAVDAVAAEPTLDAKAAALPEELVHDVGVLGSPGRVHDELRRILAAGVTPLLVPVARAGDIDAFSAMATRVATSLDLRERERR